MVLIIAGNVLLEQLCLQILFFQIRQHFKKIIQLILANFVIRIALIVLILIPKLHALHAKTTILYMIRQKYVFLVNQEPIFNLIRNLQ